jgi:uncharacterized Tic20 family protein
MLTFFAGMYCYFNCFLNITLSIKHKALENFKIKIAIYTIISIVIFSLSNQFYGMPFALKNLFVTVLLFVVQLFFLLR